MTQQASSWAGFLLLLNGGVGGGLFVIFNMMPAVDVPEGSSWMLLLDHLPRARVQTPYEVWGTTLGTVLVMSSLILISRRLTAGLTLMLAGFLVVLVGTIMGLIESPL